MLVKCVMSSEYLSHTCRENDFFDYGRDICTKFRLTAYTYKTCYRAALEFTYFVRVQRGMKVYGVTYLCPISVPGGRWLVVVCYINPK